MAKRSSAGIEVVGLDLGDGSTSWCRCAAGGQVLAEGKVRTQATALRRLFAGGGRLRILLETGSHSLWVARELRLQGHEVCVLHARSLRAITQSRRKSDRLDARVLAQLGATTDVAVLHTVDVMDETVQSDRAILLARDVLVRSRTRLISHVRGVVKAWGSRLGTGSAETFPVRMKDRIPEPLRPALMPVLESILQLNESIARYDEQLEQLAGGRYGHSRLLTQVPGVGPLTALSYLWTIRDPARFARSREVGAYLGLTPASRSSGARDPQLRISKQGNALLRRLLVQCAHRILHSPGCAGDLQSFGLRLAASGGPRGKKRAVVAVARKLAVLLHHLWKTGEVYEAHRGRLATAA